MLDSSSQASVAERRPEPRILVIDTNIVLDLFVFDDLPSKALRAGLEAGDRFDWIATADMRTELERVLGYAQIAPRLAYYGLQAETVLALFDSHSRPVEAAPRAHVVCRDPDDQRFIDLATAHRATLLSKDRAVLSMKKRLARLGVVAQAVLGDPTDQA